MKNIRITFRLSPYQLARGLQVIRQLEPTYQLTSINELVKTIYHDYLAKMTINKLDSVPANLINEITNFIETPKNQITLSTLLAERNPHEAPRKELPVKETKEPNESPDELTEREVTVNDKLADNILDEIKRVSKVSKASELNDPNQTKSEISALTDFSPPKDWMED